MSQEISELTEVMHNLCTELPEAESPASKFPQAEFAPYQSSFAWNPPGTSLDHAALPFPVLLLDSDTAVQAVAKAAYNKDKVRHCCCFAFERPIRAANRESVAALHVHIRRGSMIQYSDTLSGLPHLD